jgi:hypothetical protein
MPTALTVTGVWRAPQRHNNPPPPRPPAPAGPPAALHWPPPRRPDAPPRPCCAAAQWRSRRPARLNLKLHLTLPLHVNLHLNLNLNSWGAPRALAARAPTPACRAGRSSPGASPSRPVPWRWRPRACHVAAGPPRGAPNGWHRHAGFSSVALLWSRLHSKSKSHSHSHSHSKGGGGRPTALEDVGQSQSVEIMLSIRSINSVACWKT